MFAEIHKVRLSKAVLLFEGKSEGHENHHPPSLEDIQRRACEIPSARRGKRRVYAG